MIIPVDCPQAISGALTVAARLLTAIVIELLVAFDVVTQPALLVIMTVTTSPFCMVPVVKVFVTEPGILLPFTCHW